MNHMGQMSLLHVLPFDPNFKKQLLKTYLMAYLN